jgi:hypothetical protein
MGAWKQFLASDIIVNPFVVNKGFTCFLSAAGYGTYIYGKGYYGRRVSLNGNSCENFIDRFLGTNVNWFEDQSTTGTSNTEYQSLIYNSAKQLYYTNFLSSSTGDNVAQPVLVPGFNSSGDVLIGEVQSPLYDNFLQSTLVPNRFFPTASGAEIGVISISSKLYGEYIVPTSFKLKTTYPSGITATLVDDGEGNILLGGTGEHFGNIIYTHGIIILTVSGSIFGGYGESVYGINDYGEGFPPPSDWINNPVTCSFSSSMTIYETQYKCTLRESEFNATLNPSAQKSGSLLTVNSSSFYQRGDGTLNNNITGSYFSPYVTTVGLYDEAQNLLAIGKLAQPLPTSPTTDTTILVNIDM